MISIVVGVGGCKLRAYLNVVAEPGILLEVGGCFEDTD